MASIIQSDSIMNSVLNNDPNISCINPSSKRLLNRLSFDKNNKQISGYCSGLKLANDIASLKKDTVLDLCDCQVANLNNQLLTCPQNKFMISLTNDNKSAMCCTPCVDNINTAIDQPSCLTTTLNSCPQNSYITSVLPGKTITCCYPSLNQTIVRKQENNNKLCNEYGLSKCSDSTVMDTKNRCANAGIDQCSVNNLNNFYEKCSKYGMKYTDMLGTIHNSSSPIDCHTNNFPIIESLCKNTGIAPCNIQNISDIQMNILKNQLSFIRSIDSLKILILPTSILLLLSIIMFIIILFTTKN